FYGLGSNPSRPVLPHSGLSPSSTGVEGPVRPPCRLLLALLLGLVMRRVRLGFRGNRRSVPNEASELPRAGWRPSPDHDIARVQTLLPNLLLVCAHDAPR